MSGILQLVGRALAERAGRAYLVGPELADAMRACRYLDAHGFRSTIGFWNSETDTPSHIVDRYSAAIDAIGTEDLDCQLSVKAPALRFSPDLFRGILEHSRRGEVNIQFDSLWPEAADRTFSLITELVPAYDRIGCTLPGRWRRSLGDADRAVDLDLSVRVVKGQWSDSQGPEIDPRVGFLAIIDRLAGRVRHAAVATHDAKLAREALMRLRAAGTSCELELLFGLPVRDAMVAAKAEGARVRVYLPYGHGSLPYEMRQIKASPRIALRVLRDLFGPTRSILELPAISRPSTPQTHQSLSP